MGIITIVVIGIIVLAVLGLGWDTFFSGVMKGAEKVGIDSLVSNLTKKTQEKLTEASGDALQRFIGGN